MTPDNVTGWIAANVAFLGVEVARHGELVDWYLTAAGSVTLILYNVMKIYKILRYPHSKSEKPKKKGKG